MFKVELTFNTKLDQTMIEKMCAETDEIFRKVDLSCSDNKPGKRVYIDRGRKQDYGRFWAAIFRMKDAPDIVEGLEECKWYNGDSEENLISGFFRS